MFVERIFLAFLVLSWKGSLLFARKSCCLCTQEEILEKMAEENRITKEEYAKAANLFEKAKVWENALFQLHNKVERPRILYFRNTNLRARSEKLTPSTGKCAWLSFSIKIFIAKIGSTII